MVVVAEVSRDNQQQAFHMYYVYILLLYAFESKPNKYNIYIYLYKPNNIRLSRVAVVGKNDMYFTFDSVLLKHVACEQQV